MMRVLHVIGPLSAGGAQTQLLGLVRSAHGRLWDATVVGTAPGALSHEFEDLGCEFVELRRWGSPGLLRMRRVRQMVRDGGFDVVHGNLWQSNLYARVAVLGVTGRPAVVISERNVEARRSNVRRALDKAASRVTDAYVGNTDAVCDFIREAHPTGDRTVAMIANAVDAKVFTKRSPQTDGHRLRVGSVGRLDSEKGYDVLIEAIRILHETIPLELHLVGEGPERSRLEELARGLPVVFNGGLRPGSEVASFLQRLDVFVLPSLYREGRPNALLEALAVRLPVVATAIDGMDEILTGPVLVPPGDPSALADAVRQASNDAESWIASSAPVPVDDFDTLANRYFELFRRATSDLHDGHPPR